MKKILVGLLTIGSLSSSASMLEINGPLDQKFFNAQVKEDKSYFEVLGDMHKTGTIPSLTKLINVAWAGRCFRPENENNPRNGGTVFRAIKKDAGPISKTHYQSFNYDLGDLMPANFFDDKSISQILSTDFWNNLGLGFDLKQSDIEKAFNDVIIINDSVFRKYNSTKTSSLKLSEKYLVEEISSSDDAGPIGKSKVVERCYYFIPEYNN